MAGVTFRELAHEKRMIEEKMMRDEEQNNKERAAKRVVQQILAEEYRKEMEKKRREKEVEADFSKKMDAHLVSKMIHESEPATIQEKMVDLGDGEQSDRDPEQG